MICLRSFQSAYGLEVLQRATDRLHHTAYLVVPIVGGVLFVTLIAGIILVTVAKKKRSLHGKYNPQKQELNGHRIELHDLKMKLPAEERLI